MSTNEMSMEQAATANMVTGLIAHTLSKLDKESPSDEGVNYKPLYYFLFNGVNDIIETLTEKFSDGTYAATIHVETINALKKLHCDVEELLLEQDE